MGRLKCAIFAALVATLSGLCLAPAAAQTAGGAPAYERLNLDTPDAALRTFLSAWRNGDYLTAYWVLSVKAQTEMFRDIFAFNIGRVLRNYSGSDTSRVAQLFPAAKDSEQTDSGFLFAHMMQFASRRGMLPLDPDGLPQDLSPANVPKLGQQTQTTDGRIEIAVAMKAYGQPVVFRMGKAPSGRWRIEQIVPPGGDETTVPFGLPKN